MPSIYLDTNVISGLAKGEYAEVVAEALIQLTVLSKEGRIALHTSEIAADELALIPPMYRRQHLVIYNLIKNVTQPPVRRVPQQIMGGTGKVITWGRKLPTGNTALLQQLEALIPTKKNPIKIRARSRDIEHLHRFKQSGLDYFLTEDHKSILCYRDRLLALDIRAVSSLDLLAELK